jgi:hypothetical protein
LVPMRCRNSSLRPNEMGCSSSHRDETPQPSTAWVGNGMPHRALEGTVGTPHCVPMRCQNSPQRPNGKKLLFASEGKCHKPSPAPVDIGRPSEHRNRMSETLSSSRSDVRTPQCVRRGNGMLLILSEGNVTTPHRLGRKWDAPRSIGRKEVSEPLTASQCDVRTPHCSRTEWKLLIASGGSPTTPHRLGRERDSPQSIGVECRYPPLRPNDMSELLTATELNGMLHIA